MKPYLKITLPALALVMLLNSSCKKNNETLVKTGTADTALISKSRQLAIGFNNSLQNSLASSSTKESKTNGTSSIRVFDAQNPCGSSVVTKTSRSEVVGGEIRSYRGNTVFTYLCNGIFNNGFNVDAYSLKDTLSVYGGGPDSPTTEYTAFDYEVKAADTLYKTLNINGAQAHKTTRIAIGFGLNETSNEEYQWQNIMATRTDTQKPIITSGRIIFSINYANYFMGKGDVGDFYGFMDYLPNNFTRVTFVNSGKPNKVYLVNRTTGEVTAE